MARPHKIGSSLGASDAIDVLGGIDERHRDADWKLLMKCFQQQLDADLAEATARRIVSRRQREQAAIAEACRHVFDPPASAQAEQARQQSDGKL